MCSPLKDILKKYINICIKVIELAKKLSYLDLAWSEEILPPGFNFSGPEPKLDQGARNHALPDTAAVRIYGT